MQPHSCAAFTVFTYLHGDLVNAIRADKDIYQGQFRFNQLDVRVEKPNYEQKIYHVEVEGFSRSQSELKLRIGKDYACHVKIREIDYDAEKCKLVHGHDTVAYSEEIFQLRPYSNRFEANYKVPVPIRNTEVKHDIAGDIIGSMHLQIHNLDAQSDKKIPFTAFEMIMYDTRTDEKDPIRRRDMKYHTWVEYAQ